MKKLALKRIKKFPTPRYFAFAVKKTDCRGHGFRVSINTRVLNNKHLITDILQRKQEVKVCLIFHFYTRVNALTNDLSSKSCRIMNT